VNTSPLPLLHTAGLAGPSLSSNNGAPATADAISPTSRPQALWRRAEVQHGSPRTRDVLHEVHECRVFDKRMLKLHNRQLEHLPAVLCECRSVQVLYLHRNRLVELPPGIGTLAELQWLTLAHNRFHHLPEAVTTLRHLTRLDVAHNQLEALPEQIGLLCALEELNASNNLLVHIPASISCLSVLHLLDLKSNRLRTLPADLGRLSNLRTLLLRENRLASLPASLALAQNLFNFDARENPLLPAVPVFFQWAHLPTLTSFEGDSVSSAIFDCFPERLLDLHDVHTLGTPSLIDLCLSAVARSFYADDLVPNERLGPLALHLPRHLEERLLSRTTWCTGCGRLICGTPWRVRVRLRDVGVNRRFPLAASYCLPQCAMLRHFDERGPMSAQATAPLSCAATTTLCATVTATSASVPGSLQVASSAHRRSASPSAARLPTSRMRGRSDAARLPPSLPLLRSLERNRSHTSPRKPRPTSSERKAERKARRKLEKQRRGSQSPIQRLALRRPGRRRAQTTSPPPPTSPSLDRREEVCPNRSRDSSLVSSASSGSIFEYARSPKRLWKRK